MRILLLCLIFYSSAFSFERPNLPAEFLKKELSLPIPSFSRSFSPLRPKNPVNILPENLKDDPLIVVHASSFFDEEMSAKKGIDEIVKAYVAAGKTVIYLVHDQSEQGYEEFYPSYRTPDYELFSAGGEHNLPLKGKSVTIAGGFFGSYDGARGCHALAVRDAIRMHFENSNEPFTVNIPLEAVYFYEEDRGLIGRIMKLDPAANSFEEIKKAFENFENLFFLTDNFITSSEDSLGFAHPFTSLEQHPGYRPGQSVDTNLYSFDLYFEDILISSFGKGERKVHLKLRRKP